jgi:hypothetical protein
MDTTKVYFFLPGRLAERDYLRGREPGKHPEMLNETHPDGSCVYEDKADAEAFGRFLCTQPDTKHMRFSVVEYTLPTSLWRELETTGQMQRNFQTVLGNTAIHLTPQACGRLNRQSQPFIEEVILEFDDNDPEFTAFLELALTGESPRTWFN